MNFRRTYIKENNCKKLSMFKLVEMFNAEIYITMFNSEKFIFNSMKLRKFFYNYLTMYTLCNMYLYTYTCS